VALPPEPHPELQLQPILEVLDRRKVEYLLVGGNATQVYGATRATNDFDCLSRADSRGKPLTILVSH
jgi:hypothetical protein